MDALNKSTEHLDSVIDKMEKRRFFDQFLKNKSQKKKKEREKERKA